MSEQESRKLRENILSELTSSFEKLVQEKKESGDELVFAEKGQLKTVKAEDID
ncbi:MAG: hypothetical protein HUJ89_04145 [Bacteroidales bacterium]|nr:hypothetical protein [Bacteroidales bacterium]